MTFIVCLGEEECSLCSLPVGCIDLYLHRSRQPGGAVSFASFLDRRTPLPFRFVLLWCRRCFDALFIWLKSAFLMELPLCGACRQFAVVLSSMWSKGGSSESDGPGGGTRFRVRN